MIEDRLVSTRTVDKHTIEIFQTPTHIYVIIMNGWQLGAYPQLDKAYSLADNLVQAIKLA